MLLQGNLEQDREQELIDLRREVNEAQKRQASIREKAVMDLRRIIDEAQSEVEGNALSDSI